MTETKSLNQRIAEALGWTNLYDTKWADECGNLVYAVCGTNPQGVHDCILPDFEHSFDAFIAALGHDDVLVTFQPDQPLTLTIYDTSNDFVLGAVRKKFVASEADEGLEDADLQKLAATALLEYATWKKDEGRGSDE